MLLPLLHLSVFSIYTYTLWYDQYLNYPMPKGCDGMPFKGRLVFLVIWCLILHAVYFLIAFLNDLFGSNELSPKKRPLLRLIKDTLFVVVLVNAVCGCSIFWIVYFIDKELIFPERVSKVVPSWFNHVLHTLIILFIILELLFTNKTYPPRKVGVTLVVTFYASYLVWLHIIFEKTGVWVYPFIESLNIPSRIVFYAGTLSSGAVLCILGEKINSFVCPSPSKQADGKKIKER